MTRRCDFFFKFYLIEKNVTTQCSWNEVLCIKITTTQHNIYQYQYLYPRVVMLMVIINV